MKEELERVKREASEAVGQDYQVIILTQRDERTLCTIQSFGNECGHHI